MKVVEIYIKYMICEGSLDLYRLQQGTEAKQIAETDSDRPRQKEACEGQM